MIFDFSKSTFVITGAGRGIGYSLAKEIKDQGAEVIGLDKNFDTQKYTYEFLTKEVDLADVESVEETCKWIVEKYEKEHVLVNCAGITIPTEGHYPYENWTKTLKVNLDGPHLMIENLKDALIKSRGSVINISSLNGKIAFPDNPAYVTSKTGLDGLTRAYALDLGAHGVRVNSVAPGYIKTEMTGDSWSNLEKRKKREERTMLGRWGTVEDLSGPVMFLASSFSKYITGQTLYVDGGWSSKGF